MTLTNAHADQIATLLNERNQLTQKLTRKSVLDHADSYICRFSDANEVVACVQVKSVQWYQTEILHLTVAEFQTRKGYAKWLLCEAERVARTKGARLLQCTIRESNIGSRTLFESFGFLYINTFNNPSSGNNVMIFQKVLLCVQ
ncbi:MAG: GNAT family N-acetyltransferase [Gallionellaceae bacterium]|nr:GNAT family N-acetyltransferase [Gallionellaceae bacterium]